MRSTILPNLNRRSLLGGLVAAPLVLQFGRAAAGAPTLFTQGVASGDPAPDGFVLWTRLAANPLAPDGLGGLSEPIDTLWEVAGDEAFRKIEASGRVTATSVTAHAVHVEVTGLRPARPYWYRFTAGGEQSAVGRAMTAPRASADVDRLRLAVASCAHWERGYFSAYGHMADESPDLTLFLGDYIYEYSLAPDRGDQIVRPYGLEEATSLAGYRNRYALHRTDPDLQRLHAIAPAIAIWDDHEVHDDYSGVWSKTAGVSHRVFLERRAAAYRAFREAMPLRSTARGGSAPLYRHLRFGRLAEFFMLDGRQYRSRQPCSDDNMGGKGRLVTDALCAERLDPSRTFLGFEQERWLYDGLARASARWTLLGQNLVLAGLRIGNGSAAPQYWTDTWDGFPAARSRLTETLATIRPNNPVVLSGDYHSFWTNDVKRDASDPHSETIATEFVGTSITSGGPPHDALTQVMPFNPQVRYFEGRRRGYMSIDITPRQMTTRFRAIGDVRDPKTPVATLNSWVVESGRAGAVLQ